ncbi:MAG: glycosyltransferase [Peptoniphilaceae bacterium]|nr:glycosyltransferase [Peptoniphilaceae bacterium]MDY6018755.1 glycosyltransferase [Anaerococcus sp.]
MKILITSDWYYPIVNGVVRSILNLKQYLIDQGHDVRVLTLSHSIKSYKEDGVYYIRSLGAGKVYPDARMSGILRSKEILELIDWKPDIIHSQCEFSTFIMAKKISKKTKAPIVHTYHTVYEDYTHYFSPSKKVGKKLIATLSRAVAKKVDKMIVPSIKTKNILLSYDIDEAKISVIPTGIEISKLSDKKTLREKYGYKDCEKILLYLGRLAEEKNIEELMDFYQKISLKDSRFLIVGGGPYLDKLKKYAKKIDKKIDFIGQVDPAIVKDYYQLADVFVSASKSETQGLTYYEALSNGRLALCRKDSCLEGVIINNFNGYQYRDLDDFIEFLTIIFKDQDNKALMEENARRYALENFSIESFGKKCEKEYLKVLKKQGG